MAENPPVTRAWLVLVFSLSLLLAPAQTLAQPPTKPPRVGYLNLFSIPSFLEGFKQGLRDHGWRDGENIIIEARHANGQVQRVHEVVAELVRLKVDVLLISATAIREAKPRTGNIPIVFAIADDPVRAGLVASLSRPGGRLTGITSLNVELDAKRLEILKSALPGVTRVAALTMPRDPATRDRVAATERVARSLGVELQLLETSSAADLPSAFDAASRGRAGALMVFGSAALFTHQKQIAELAAAARLPVISAWREFAEAGGFMAYGTNVPAMFRRAASYVDRILKGANPAELPVEQANTFELVINARAARGLKIAIPPALTLRADAVIQ